jgi:hypothetical protein
MEALEMFAEKDPDDIDFASAIKLDKKSGIFQLFHFLDKILNL